MRSKLAEASEQSLIEAARRLSREQRLLAYAGHCHQVLLLREAGRVLRDTRHLPGAQARR